MAVTDVGTAHWIKSSYSANNGACIEVSFTPGVVATRDSKDPAAGALTCSPAAFRAFLRTVTAA